MTYYLFADDEVAPHRAAPLASSVSGAPDFEALVEQAQVGILVTQDGRFLYANAKLADMFGHRSAEQFLNTQYTDCIHPDDQARVLEIIRRRLSGEDDGAYECRCVRVDGTVFDARVYGRLVSFRGRLASLVTLSDISDLTRAISERSEAQSRVQRMANYHAVTGLPNRSLLLGRIRAALAAAGRDGSEVAVLQLHISHLARVEGTMGFGVSDALAAAVAARLSAPWSATGAAPVADAPLLAHIGTGDFAVLVAASAAPIAEAAAARAAVLLEALKEPVTVDATEFFLSGKVGIALFPNDAAQAEPLLDCAQAACSGGDEHQDVGQFSWQTSQRALRRMNLETALHRAVQGDSLTLHYQPQVDLNDGSIVGVEALLRWHCPTLGEIAPEELVQVAETCGLFGAIGDWVMRAACRQTVAWAQAGLPPLRIAINLSPKQLQQTDVSGRLQAIILETGADPTHLGVEVTESMLAGNLEHARRMLRELRAIGVQVAIDDIGIGHSNLSLLRSMPFDVLKIDRSLVYDVTAAAEDVSLTRAVLAMAHSLHLKVLAEGVETAGQLDLLAANGCDLIQGFLFSEAVPPEAIAAMLQQDRRLPERFHLRRQHQRTLLLVDAEDGVLSSLRRLLRLDGYHIVTAGSGAEGLQQLAEHDVDVILADQRMPGMTGVEFLRRAKELCPDTVRLVLSGYTELQSITDAVNEGAIYKFLTKPWDGAQLRAHVQEAFRRKEMSDDNRRLALEVQRANDELARANERLEHLLDRQRERAQLEEGRAVQARQMLEHLPAAVVGVDTQGMLVFVNQRARQWLIADASPAGDGATDPLPEALREAWRQRSAEAVRVRLPCGPCLVVCNEMRSGAILQGHLLVVTPDTETALS